MKKLYAIGDVHGRAEFLSPLLDAINEARGPEDILVFLGDYIDRGLDSRGVIDLVLAELAAHPDHSVALWGNHEDMAAAACRLPSPCGMGSNAAKESWLRNGGMATLGCYYGSIHEFRPHFEKLLPHLQLWMRPYGFEMVAPEVICVHAGVPAGESAERLAEISPEPNLATLSGREVLLWMHPQPLDKRDPSRLVICGHTPRINEVVNETYHICVDTGAGYDGRLTALELGADGSRAFWHTSGGVPIRSVRNLPEVEW